MPIRTVGDLKIFQFASFTRPELTHGILSRVGGVSPDPWCSLNVGGFIGDDPDRVAENLKRSFNALNRQVRSKHDVWQVHGAHVQIASEPRGSSYPAQGDILITDNPHVSLFMRFADCVPILIYDPIKKVIALAHAGWKGVTLNAPGNAVMALSDHFGSSPEDLQVGLGPAICVECYPIGEDVVRGVEKVFEGKTADLLWLRNDQRHLDLTLACQRLLERAGVKDFELSGICTAMNLDDWYSHRAEGGRTGRFGVLFALSA